MIYNVYDSEGYLVKGGFHTFMDAFNWKWVFGNIGYTIEHEYN